MSHPIILACLALRGQWFSVKTAIKESGLCHSTVRHRLEALAAAGLLERRVLRNHLTFHVRKVAQLIAIRDGQEPLPGLADTRPMLNASDVTLPLAKLLGYATPNIQAKARKIEREDWHNPDAQSRAGHIYGCSSLEVV